MKPFHFASIGAVALQLVAGTARAQAPAPQAAAAQEAQSVPAGFEVVPLKVVVTLSRFDGDKRTSSLPYTLSVNANRVNGEAANANLRMGTRVAVPMTTISSPAPSGQAKEAAKPMTSFTYEDVGTNIDLRVRRTDPQRFSLTITVTDSSVVEDKAKPTANPSFRNFSAVNQVVLRDGESAQFSTAPDKVTGEVVKIDVSLNIVK